MDGPHASCAAGIDSISSRADPTHRKADRDEGRWFGCAWNVLWLRDENLRNLSKIRYISSLDVATTSRRRTIRTLLDRKSERRGCPSKCMASGEILITPSRVGSFRAGRHVDHYAKTSHVFDCSGGDCLWGVLAGFLGIDDAEGGWQHWSAAACHEYLGPCKYRFGNHFVPGQPCRYWHFRSGVRSLFGKSQQRKKSVLNTIIL
jgi:hypothetical protein